MQKPSRRTTFCWLAALWVLFIFSLSVFSPQQSEQQSNYIHHIIKPITETLSDSTETQSNIVRKSAHVFEYSVLGGLLCGAYWNRRRGIRGCWKNILLLCLTVPLTDETIQCFSERTASVTDIWLDAVSTGVAFFATVGICILVTKRKSKKEKRS